MNARGLIVSIVILTGGAVISGAGVAAHQQVPARDVRQAAAAPKGTAELSVLVTTDQEPSQPVRRASVSIRAGELDVPHIGLTDDEGRVVFRDLAAGNYLLQAERSGYVRTFYGSTQPGRGPGVAITLLEGQRVGGIRMRLLRGGVITGTLRNVSGRPAPNQSVRAIMIRSSGGERRAIEEENLLGLLVATDDRGVYRIFGLPPGDYLVSVPLSGLSTDQMRQVSADELAWADKMVGSTGVNYAAVPTPPPAPSPKPPVAYSPVYYPGTAVASEAVVITLGPNEERPGIDFALNLVPTAKISGRVVDVEGRPQTGQSVSVKPTRPDGMDLFASLRNANGFTDQTGAFEIAGVRPGTYTLTVRATPKTGAETTAKPSDMDAARQAMASLFGGGSTTSHWAVEDVSVQGTDIGGINLVLRPGMTVSGKVVYESGTKVPPADLTKTQIALLAAPSGSGISELASLFTGGSTTNAKVAADGTFTIVGVAPGRYRLNTPFGLIPTQMVGGLNMTGGWTLKSVMANGRDIADAVLDMKAGTDVANVIVTFTDRPAELSGSVVDGAGRVTPSFPIVVFSTDRSYWTLASRRVQTARPSSDGQFKVTALPPGEYYVCAVTAVDRTEAYDPAFLEQLVPVAFKITVADGEKKVVNLKLGGG